MNVRRALQTGGLLVALAGLLASCSSPAPPAPGGSSQSATGGSAAGYDPAHRGGELKMIWQNAGTSIDPAVDYDPNWFVLRMANDGLMAWKQVEGADGNTLVPDLAAAIPTATDGGRTYAFTVRPGVKYSTGGTVAPSDFAASMLRQFTIPGPGVGIYGGIVGAQKCISKPAACDLSAGVVADDAAGTVTFHLTAPDPDFLQKLALPFAYVLPKGTKATDTGTKPLPATGPYMIESWKPNSSMRIVRNPAFATWSDDAQPDGYPDVISMQIGLADADAVTQVENGQADWMYNTPPPDRLDEVATKYASQVHVNPAPINYYMALNTRVAPFDNQQVRQALNFATDRAALVQLFGGTRLATPTCQILPADFPGYQANCPYTKDPGPTWSAPDLDKAKALVAQSGTAGQTVQIIGTPDKASQDIDQYFVSVLNDLGYKASVKTLAADIAYGYVQDSKNKAQMYYSYWSPDYTSASNFLNVAVGCSGFSAGSSASPNLAEFCDPAIEAKTKQALKVQQDDVGAANQLWAGIDRDTTAAAPWVSLYTASRLDFVSARVGNFRFNPSVTGLFMIDQAWVQ
jgi:peptide/nickel transport system substrate-binding protein